MTEEPKGVLWVMEQLENISEAMIPSETCVNCKDCPEVEFENCMKGMGLAISELASMMVRMIQHINVLYDVVGNILSDPEKVKENMEKLEKLIKSGFEGLYS